MAVAHGQGVGPGRTSLEEGEHVLRLPDGRTLGYAVCGAARGHPVLYAHGFPSSRLEARLFAGAALRTGVTLIAPDRPGFGRSEFQPGRRIADWADDMAHLVGALGLSRLSLLGASGGCPFTLGCVERLRGRLEAVGIIAGLGPVEDPQVVALMSPAARAGFSLARRAPRAFAALYGALGAAVARQPDLIFVLNRATPPDREVLAQPEVRATLREAGREAFRAGTAGPLHELRLISHPWGFDLQSIETPVVLWHGLEDGVVPVEMGRAMASRLPAADLRLLPGEGHVSLPLHQGEAILRELLP